VVVDVISIKNGDVSGVDIKKSAGVLFDEAAKKILSFARFSPARMGEKTVAVENASDHGFYVGRVKSQDCGIEE
jgi:outer membrane biosynthesis protein TonB